jgi:hypothetical protein
MESVSAPFGDLSLISCAAAEWCCRTLATRWCLLWGSSPVRQYLTFTCLLCAMLLLQSGAAGPWPPTCAYVRAALPPHITLRCTDMSCAMLLLL